MRADTAGEDSKGHADGEVRSAVVQRAREFGGPTPSNAPPRMKAWDSVASPAPRASQGNAALDSVISLHRWGKPRGKGEIAPAAQSLRVRHVVKGQRGSLLEACDMQGSDMV